MFTEAQSIIDQALCHAALVYERLIGGQRNLGLSPRTATSEDPLAPLVVSDTDVAAILAGFRRLAATPPAGRAGLLPDVHAAALDESRARLLEAISAPTAPSLGLARLIRAFDLSAPAIDVLLLALAPDWDLRIARLAGFLNDDITRRRPLFGHALLVAEAGLPSTGIRATDLLRTSLVDAGLLLRADQEQTPAALREISVPGYLVELSLSVLDDAPPREKWDDLRWPAAERDALRAALGRELDRGTGRRLVLLTGAPGSGRASAARAAAADAGIGLVEHALGDGGEAELAGAAYRAKLCGAALAVRWRHTPDDGRLFARLSQLARRLDVSAFALVGPAEVDALTPEVAFVRLDMPRLGPGERRILWQLALDRVELSAPAAVLDELAARYDVSPGRLTEVAGELRVRNASEPSACVAVRHVRETLREITVQRLANLARRYASDLRLEDLLFPSGVGERIAELASRLRHRQRVLANWSFADRAHQSFGVSALFVGPSGTGKTAAAAAIANALDIDLYVVDLSRIMSKWVGETEQNLARVFDEAEASNVALLFDEADALFGKRSVDQRDGADRYANLTVNYLLQRMETYSGLAILTTNLASAMDEAFQRRVTLTVRFPPADDELRERLWHHLLPAGATYAGDVNLRELARFHRMEGAHIRRSLTRAAFQAASRDQELPRLTKEDVLWAARAEYEDMGRLACDTRATRRSQHHDDS